MDRCNQCRFRSAHRWAALLGAALVWVAVLSGCDKARDLLGGADEADNAQPPPESVEFEVDANGVLYGTLRPDGSLVGADRLARVPLAERAALVVHVADHTPQDPDHYYVADLLDAQPGDTATAKLRSAQQVRDRLDAGEHGALGGLYALRVARTLLDVPPTPEQASESSSGAGADSRRRSPRAAQPKSKNQDHVIELFDDEELSEAASNVESQSVGGHDIEIRRFGGDTQRSGRAPSPRAKAPSVPAGARWRPVTLYYADWCGVCSKARAFLDNNNVPYRAVDIEASEKNQREMVQFCRQKRVRADGIPVLRIGDDIMTGWSSGRFLEMARLR